MSEAPTPQSNLPAVIAAVIVLLVAFAPTLLLGDRLSAFGLLVTGVVLAGVGLVARAGRGQRARTFGAILVVAGALISVAAVALLVLLIGGLGRGV